MKIIKDTNSPGTCTMSLKENSNRSIISPNVRHIKNNSKKLWELINNTINKVKHKGSIIPFITVDGLKQNRPKVIANSFGEFYSILGSSLAGKIVPGTTSMEEYLDSIPVQRDSMVTKQTTPLEIDTIIRNLPNQTSH